MTKRKMFLRMVSAALLRRRSRMLIALLSIAVGATILAGLLTIYYDVPRQMGAQFRSYGANMILLPKEEVLTQTAVDEALSLIPTDKLIGAAPYRYVRVDMETRQQSFTAAGTNFNEIQKTSPYFNVEGRYPQNPREVLVGKEVAEIIGATIGSVIDLSYQPPTTAANATTTEAELTPNAILEGTSNGWNNGEVGVTVQLDADGNIAHIKADVSKQSPMHGALCKKPDYLNQYTGKRIPLEEAEIDAVSGATLTANAVFNAVNTSHPKGVNDSHTLNFTVVGILDTGGDEESYVFFSMKDMGILTGNTERLDVMELSVSASADELTTYITEMATQNSTVMGSLVKRVTRSEASVLTKLQSLVLLVTIVVLLLTMICVSTTMTAVVSERRREIGLRKALGATDNSIRLEFLGEGILLGFLGGLVGALFGFAFAQFVSVNVFGSSITFQPLLVPLSIIVSMGIAALSCLLPIKRAVSIDPAKVLKGE